MATKPSPFTRVDELLKTSLKDLRIEETFQIYPIWKQWSELVGPAIAAKTRPDYVRGKTLVVSVENSVWMNELEMQKRTLLQKMAALNLDPPINEIRFRMKGE